MMNATLTKSHVASPVTTPSGTHHQALACVEAYDALLGHNYTFVAYKETDSDGRWRVCIRSSRTAGAVLEPATMNATARAANADGKTWFTSGYSLNPSAADARCVQFRVHVANGAPSRIEVFVQLRRLDGTAKTPTSIAFPWPTN